jgi:hypothetical protein
MSGGRSGRRDLSPLFRPTSIAVIGATGDTGHVRGRITAQLLNCGYPGSRSRTDRGSRWDFRDRIREIDRNPVIIGAEGEGVAVVDALVVQEARQR